MTGAESGPGATDRPLTVLIVDDEPLARRGVRARLVRMVGIEVLAECASGADAVRAIRALTPDLVFLDVQMPGLDGFGVIRSIGPERMPAVIFLTAFEAHALRAFDAHAIDYLLKPVDDERFAQAVERAKRRVAEQRAGDLVQRLTAAIADAGTLASTATAPGEGLRTRLAVRDRGRVLFLEADEIDWVEADGDYVRLHTGARSHLVRETMHAMTARLPAPPFTRIHRSFIVNAGRVRAVQPAGRESVVVLRDGTRLRVSRGYRDQLDAAVSRVR